MYEYYFQRDPEKGLRFARAMENLRNSQSESKAEEIYPFADLRPGAVVVDLGGGLGHNSIRMSGKLPTLKFIVQDCQQVIDECKDIQVGLAVSWRVHDIFTEQPVKGEDVYYISHIFMDHPDEQVFRLSIYRL